MPATNSPIKTDHKVYVWKLERIPCFHCLMLIRSTWYTTPNSIFMNVPFLQWFSQGENYYLKLIFSPYQAFCEFHCFWRASNESGLKENTSDWDLSLSWLSCGSLRDWKFIFSLFLALFSSLDFPQNVLNWNNKIITISE